MHSHTHFCLIAQVRTVSSYVLRKRELNRALMASISASGEAAAHTLQLKSELNELKAP